jgi:DNA-binding FadR family transcriptional regulator
MRTKPELSEELQATIEAVWILRDRLGRAPSEREIAEQLGMSKTATRARLQRCAEQGLMTVPRRTVRGEYALLPSAEKRVKGAKRLTRA